MCSDTNTSKQASKNYCLMLIFSEHTIGHFLQMFPDIGHASKTEKKLDSKKLNLFDKIINNEAPECLFENLTMI
jgi:hypothetical protein